MKQDYYIPQVEIKLSTDKPRIRFGLTVQIPREKKDNGTS